MKIQSCVLFRECKWVEGKGREGDGEGRRTHETAQVLCSVGRKRILAGDGWVEVLRLPVLAGIVVLFALETVGKY